MSISPIRQALQDQVQNFESLQNSVDELESIIKHLEKNPSTMREAFFIELIKAYEVIHQNVKNNTKFSVSNTKKIQEQVKEIQSILTNLPSQLDTELSKILSERVEDLNNTLIESKNEIIQLKKDLKDIGKAYLELEKRIDRKLEVFIKTSSNFQKLFFTNIALICLTLFLLIIQFLIK